MSAFGLTLSVPGADSPAGVAVPGSLTGATEVFVSGTKADGLPFTGLTTALVVQTRATAGAPWIPVASIQLDPAEIPVPVREIRVQGVVDPADDPAVVQVFGRVI